MGLFYGLRLLWTLSVLSFVSRQANVVYVLQVDANSKDEIFIILGEDITVLLLYFILFLFQLLCSPN